MSSYERQLLINKDLSPRIVTLDAPDNNVTLTLNSDRNDTNNGHFNKKNRYYQRLRLDNSLL